MGRLEKALGLLMLKMQERPAVIDSFEGKLRAAFQASRDSFVSKRFSPGSAICPRLKAYQRLEGFHLGFREPDEDTIQMFAMGSAIHETLQQKILPTMGGSWGNWVCPSCGTRVNYSMRPVAACSNQVVKTELTGDTSYSCRQLPGKGQWVYEELYVKYSPINDPLYEISAKIDHVYVESDVWYILEIKSVDNGLFNATYTTKHPDNPEWRIEKPAMSILPKPNNVLQGQVCGSLLIETAKRERFALPATTYGGVMLLYVNRNDLQFRSYTLPPNLGAIDDIVAAVENTKAAVDAKNAGLAKAACSKRESTLAKLCPKRDICFPLKRAKKETP